MTTTRPNVHFREPQDSSFDILVQENTFENGINYQSLSCEGCDTHSEVAWDSLGLTIALSGLVLLLVLFIGNQFIKK